MILIAGYVQYGPGAIDTLKAEMQTMIAATRDEDGCINYDFAVHVADPDKLVIFERWRDAAALDGHFKSAHMAALRKAGAGVAMVSRALSRWEVSDGQNL